VKLPSLATTISRPRRGAAAGTALVVVGVCALIVTLGVGSAGSAPIAGSPVPAKDTKVIIDAAKSCPALSPPKLAGQIMEASRFEPNGVTSHGGQGIAGLTDTVWKKWAPWPGARRTDSRASIIGLAHYMCELIGQVRAAGVAGDQWRLGLGAYHSDITAVRAARDVPTQASNYVDVVAGYAAWYAMQPQFGGRGIAEPTPRFSGPPISTATETGRIPDAYVRLVLAAGKVCPEVTPARVAAQLMAMSGFDAKHVGASGAAGIAQFLPHVWTRYAPSAGATPLDPKAAIPALGRAMCDLTAQMKVFPGDPYVLALAAYLWGTDALTQPEAEPRVAPVLTFVRQVLVYADLYARDTRLAASTPSSEPTTSASSTRPTPAPAQVSALTSPQPDASRSIDPAPSSSPAGRALVSEQSGKCLSATRGMDGTVLEIWPCDGSMPQQWTVMPDGTVRSVGLCMDVAGASTVDMADVQVATCNGHPAQLFQLTPEDDLVSLYTNRCVDVSFEGTDDGTRVVVHTCHGGANQTWHLR